MVYFRTLGVLLPFFFGIWSASAFALADGFYTGIGLGISSSAYSASNVKVDIPSLGLKEVPLSVSVSNFAPLLTTVPASGDASASSTSAGGRLYMGYKFYKLFAIEAAYTKFADSTIEDVFNVAAGEFTTIPNTQSLIVGANTRVSSQSLDLSGKIFVPILDLFQVWGQLGMAYLNTYRPNKANFLVTLQDGGGTLTQIKLQSANDYTYQLMYGFGFGYSFDDRFTLDLAYHQVQPQGNTLQNSSLLSIDFAVSFG